MWEEEEEEDRPEVYAHMEKVKQLIFFITGSAVIIRCNISAFVQVKWVVRPKKHSDVDEAR